MGLLLNSRKSRNKGREYGFMIGKNDDVDLTRVETFRQR